jgi:hypothetical protein
VLVLVCDDHRRVWFWCIRLACGSIVFWRRLLLFLRLFNILKVFVVGNYVCEKIFGVDKFLVGKCNTQRIECKYLLLCIWVSGWCEEFFGFRSLFRCTRW